MRLGKVVGHVRRVVPVHSKGGDGIPVDPLLPR